ncbi:hypothetical protein GCM10027275_39910 [Rhabdobacter roseus]|uniref:Uncharacterized protein n=2 Tax=Rhabdobacter roseus TaxID=1655419 RepID=A0A840TZV5_9BACT|nr:hypothetical protein [Rhabdobacter roseus]
MLNGLKIEIRYSSIEIQPAVRGMTIQEQIQRDVALISENSYLQTQLYDFLRLLKANMPRKSNVDEVLALAGTIDNEDTQEITQIINEEFNKIDGDWN